MIFEPLPIAGSWKISPKVYPDSRGEFAEVFRADLLKEACGRSFTPVQVNLSQSREGVLRGIHASRRDSGQAKYVMCPSGQIVDAIVDLRSESPTFGQTCLVNLDGANREAVFISEGLGHGFLATSPSATVLYATNRVFTPSADFAIDPRDPILAIQWPLVGHPIMSEQDSTAPKFSWYVRHAPDVFAPRESAGS